MGKKKGNDEPPAYRISDFGPFCHGTHTGILPQIFHEGLKPRTWKGKTRGSVYEFAMGPESLKDRIYLAGDPPNYETECGSFAQTAAAAAGSLNPELCEVVECEEAVLQIKLTGRDEGKLFPDEDWTGYDHGEIVNEDLLLERCEEPLKEIRDSLLRGEDPEFIWGGVFSHLADTREMLEWLTTNPSDEEIEGYCDNAPEWWKSLAVGGTVAFRGTIPATRLTVMYPEEAEGVRKKILRRKRKKRGNGAKQKKRETKRGKKKPTKRKKKAKKKKR